MKYKELVSWAKVLDTIMPQTQGGFGWTKFPQFCLISIISRLRVVLVGQIPSHQLTI